MYKRLSNNAPLRRDDKKEVRNFPLDDRFIYPSFDMVLPLLGKYISSDNSCLVFYQNNTSQRDTMTSELFLARFGESLYQNDLKCTQKVPIDLR